MSTLKTNNVQVGQSVTATNNFTLYQPATPDGTVRLGNGNSGSVTDVASFTSAGVFAFNSGYGSVAPVYGCRAWVNFNGTGTVAIRASGNVSSITDNGTGDYTISFTTAMPDANFEVNGVAYYPGVAVATLGLSSLAAGSVRVNAINAAGSASIDVDQMHVSVFR